MAVLAYRTTLLGSHKGHQRHVRGTTAGADPAGRQHCSGSTAKERSLPEPETVYPTMVFNKANILEMMPLTMKQPWLSPQSISGWPLLLDIDRPSFKEWDKRIGME
jgi:hypothetical protein